LRLGVLNKFRLFEIAAVLGVVTVEIADAIRRVSVAVPAKILLDRNLVIVVRKSQERKSVCEKYANREEEKVRLIENPRPQQTYLGRAVTFGRHNFFFAHNAWGGKSFFLASKHTLVNVVLVCCCTCSFAELLVAIIMGVRMIALWIVLFPIERPLIGPEQD
jgi:hypothetical protein